MFYFSRKNINSITVVSVFVFSYFLQIPWKIVLTIENNHFTSEVPPNKEVLMFLHLGKSQVTGGEELVTGHVLP